MKSSIDTLKDRDKECAGKEGQAPSTSRLASSTSRLGTPLSAADTTAGVIGYGALGITTVDARADGLEGGETCSSALSTDTYDLTPPSESERRDFEPPTKRKETREARSDYGIPTADVAQRMIQNRTNAANGEDTIRENLHTTRIALATRREISPGGVDGSADVDREASVRFVVGYDINRKSTSSSDSFSRSLSGNEECSVLEEQPAARTRETVRARAARLAETVNDDRVLLPKGGVVMAAAGTAAAYCTTTTSSGNKRQRIASILGDSTCHGLGTRPLAASEIATKELRFPGQGGGASNELAQEELADQNSDFMRTVRTPQRRGNSIDYSF